MNHHVETRVAAAAIVAPFWEWVRSHWAGFWASDPVIWLCIFWAADWVLGSAVAVKDGLAHPDDPRRGWRARRAARSAWKLLKWLAALGIAWGLRQSHVVGLSIAATMLEAAVILTESGSALRNLGILTDSKLLAAYGDVMDSRAAYPTTKIQRPSADKPKTGPLNGAL